MNEVESRASVNTAGTVVNAASPLPAEGEEAIVPGVDDDADDDDDLDAVDRTMSPREKFIVEEWKLVEQRRAKEDERRRLEDFGREEADTRRALEDQRRVIENARRMEEDDVRSNVTSLPPDVERNFALPVRV